MITHDEELQINMLVYEKYPLKKIEETCWQERQKRSELRKLYRERLESEIEQSKIQAKPCKQDGLL